MSDTERFVGVWRLVEYVIEGPDGQVIRPLGSAPKGQIVYTAAGRTAAHLMHGGEADEHAQRRLLRRLPGRGRSRLSRRRDRKCGRAAGLVADARVVL